MACSATEPNVSLEVLDAESIRAGNQYTMQGCENWFTHWLFVNDGKMQSS